MGHLYKASQYTSTLYYVKIPSADRLGSQPVGFVNYFRGNTIFELFSGFRKKPTFCPIALVYVKNVSQFWEENFPTCLSMHVMGSHTEIATRISWVKFSTWEPMICRGGHVQFGTDWDSGRKTHVGTHDMQGRARSVWNRLGLWSQNPRGNPWYAGEGTFSLEQTRTLVAKPTWETHDMQGRARGIMNRFCCKRHVCISE